MSLIISQALIRITRYYFKKIGINFIHKNTTLPHFNFIKRFL